VAAQESKYNAVWGLVEMSLITQSGIYPDNSLYPQLFLVTQGSLGYTLVDKKKILFRLYLDPGNLGHLTSVFARIKYLGTNIPNTEMLIPLSSLLIENSHPNGPSVGIVFQGSAFPSASPRYVVEFYLFGNGDRLPIGRFVITTLKFEKSGRLRILAKAIESITGTAPWGNKILSNITWLIDLAQSMERFGAMLPVSDGVVSGTNPGPDDGLAYVIGENTDAWPLICPSGNPPSVPDNEFPNVLVCPKEEGREADLKEAKQLRALGVRIDVTVDWRLRDPLKFPPDPNTGGHGEGCGGSAPQASDRFAGLVGGNLNGVEFTAPLFAQEVAHTFGAVAKDSPHYDGGSHSKDTHIIDPFAFDFVRLRPYSSAPPGPGNLFLEDVMHGTLSEGRDSNLYNAFDWEYLRKKLVELETQALTNLHENEGQKKLVEEVQKPFVGLQRIQVEDPKSTLYSKSGSEWHWTSSGFQLLIEGKPKTNRSGLAPSAESIIFALRELGIKEIYAPIDGKPLSVVVPTTPVATCHINDMPPSG
jgi:hypothetical protein